MFGMGIAEWANEAGSMPAYLLRVSLDGENCPLMNVSSKSFALNRKRLDSLDGLIRLELSAAQQDLT